MDKIFVTLNLAGQKYDYIYDREAKKIFTVHFPDVPVVRVHLGCGHSVDHNTLLKIIEDRQKSLEMLAELF